MRSLPDLLEFLARRQAGEVDHSDRSLMEHLKGTHDLLRSWGCDGDVCAAGLFHSVYGTPDYATRIVSPDDRDEIVEMIGRRAENLVFRFSVLGHSKALEFCATCGPDEEVAGLLELCLANFLEQEAILSATMVRDLLLRDRPYWLRSLPKLPQPACSALERLFCKHQVGAVTKIEGV